MSVVRVAAVGAVLLVLVGCQGEVKVETKVETEEDKTYYALGQAVARGLGSFQGKLSREQVELVKKGLEDAALGRESLAPPEDYLPKVRQLAQAYSVAEERLERGRGQLLLENAQSAEGAVTTASGLVYQELVAGTGAQPQADNTVKVHYRGSLADGTVFGNSYEGEALELPLSQAYPGFAEGVQMLKVGGKARLVLPPEIGAGPQGQPPKIPPGATLIFEVELLDII